MKFPSIGMFGQIIGAISLFLFASQSYASCQYVGNNHSSTSLLGHVVFTNDGSEPISDWQISVDYPNGQIDGAWGDAIWQGSNTTLFDPIPSNPTMHPAQSWNIYFNASSNDGNVLEAPVLQGTFCDAPIGGDTNTQTDTDTSTDTQTDPVEIIADPIITRLSAEIQVEANGLTVELTPTLNLDPTQFDFLWKFEDGGQLIGESIGENAQYTFTDAGSYNIQLNVYKGELIDSYYSSITVEDPATGFECHAGNSTVIPRGQDTWVTQGTCLVYGHSNGNMQMGTWSASGDVLYDIQNCNGDVMFDVLQVHGGFKTVTTGTNHCDHFIYVKQAGSGFNLQMHSW